ncbi:glycosyltransferase family 4 protein [Pontibacter chinhatensis]|uniref:Glycosyltransferase involved in cell wall bisynthesis n=1 Tax=Pontibacter chinhatensis TaxID=1436961 RepID=A0A1I2QWU9_9BACT|nr:glycosyltransferase family 4 protein [Pontibacter chinhatensis]SFG32844.1 Glycosyltransferase involved in cell wall bisynthesis [Pontibacter chinhatensis]
MKIIFAIDTLQTGGAEKSTLDIASRLPNDIEPLIVSFYNNLELKNECDKLGLRNINFAINNKYDFGKAINLFKSLCIIENPNLVVSTLFRADIITRVACHQLGIKNIGTFVNDTYSSHELEDLSFSMKLKVGLFWILNRWTARYCYRFLANSESIKISNSQRLLIDNSKIDVIYRGRKVSNFNFKIANRFTNEETHFLNVGRLLKRKGQAELIEAFANFNKIYPNTKLSIAGEGKYRAHLEALIKRLNIGHKIKLLGNVKNVPELLAECDVFVFPSYYEGFSGALVEAMLGGAPILASDIPMNKEAINHLDTAYLFKVKDVVSLEEALVFSIANTDKMKEMAQKARMIAEQKYDIDQIAKQHAAIYRNYIE